MKYKIMAAHGNFLALSFRATVGFQSHLLIHIFDRREEVQS